jgi:dUTP pyrophosphatase
MTSEDTGRRSNRYPRPVRLEFVRLDPTVEVPSAAREGDAGLDLAANVDAVVGPGERTLIPTGLAVAIPEGHAGMVLPRSGLASREGLTLANAPGLIDSGYRGEVTLSVVNLDRERAVEIRRGDRIAQLVVVPVGRAEPVAVERLEETARGAGGFGSTGVGDRVRGTRIEG